MHEGRLLHEDGTVETIPASDWATADQTGYTFLNRPRHDRDSCIAAGGTFYYGANRSLGRDNLVSSVSIRRYW